jgi:hypothetical protein
LTRARSEIHDHPLVAGDQAGQLADVYLGEVAADDLAHGAHRNRSDRYGTG